MAKVKSRREHRAQRASVLRPKSPWGFVERRRRLALLRSRRPEKLVRKPKSFLGRIILEILHLDEATTVALARTRSPLLDRLLPPLSTVLAPGMIWAGVSALLATNRRGRAAAKDGIKAFTMAAVAANILKLIVKRPPPVGKAAPKQRRATPHPRVYSYPSGHAASGFAYTMAAGGKEPLLFPPLLGLSWLLAYSTVFTIKHYPGDVLSGAALGLTTGALLRLRRQVEEEAKR